MNGSRLVGRQTDLHALHGSFRRATSKRAQLVAIAGEAGIGKTRLIHEHLGREPMADALLLVGGGQPDLGLTTPYGPLVEAFRDIPDDVGLGKWLSDPANDGLAPLMPMWYPEISVLKLSSGRLLELCLRLLRELSRRRPTVLVLEDLHWSDAATVNILTFLARNLTDERLQLIISFRNDELPVDHVLRTFLSTAARREEFIRLELSALSEVEVDSLVLQHVSVAADDRRRAIQERGDGNPFLLEELCAAQGRLPESLRDHVADRMHGLSPAARHTLNIVATNGGSLSFALMRHFVITDDSIRSIIESGLIELDHKKDGAVFRHALLADLVYETMLPNEQQQLHGELAQALLVLPGNMTPELASAVARHWMRAARPADALMPIIVAARSAAARFAYGDADHLYDRVMQVWGQVDEAESISGSLRSEILLEWAESARWSDRLDRAIALVEEALSSLPTRGGNLLESTAWERLARYRWETGHGDSALLAARRATAVLSGEGASHQAARAIAALAALLMVRGHFLESLPIAREAVGMARSIGAIREVSYALTTAGVANASVGHIEAGLSDLRESLRLAKEVSALEDVGRAYVNLTYVLDLAYRLDEAVDTALEGLEFTRRFGVEHTAGRLLRPNAVSTLKTLGRWPEAYQLLDQVSGNTPRGHQVYLDLIRVDLDLVTGRSVESGAFDRLGPAVEEMEELWATGLLAICKTQDAVWRGKHSIAVGIADAGLRTLGNAGEDQMVVRLVALALGALADSTTRATAPADLQTQADDLLAHLAALRNQPSCVPTVLLCEAERHRLTDRADDSRWLVVLADPSVATQPYLWAYASFRLAEVRCSASSADAAASVESAMVAAHRLGAAPLEGWIRRLAIRAHILVGQESENKPTESAALTPREQEVLGHLAQGASNRAIARALFISERTVGIHVGNILRKLGAESRGQAVALARNALP